jgi:hypothetical protein
MMRARCKPLVLGAAAAALFAADVAPDAPLRLRLVPEAQAIIGMPLTPMSYAGVARRTTRRVVYTEAAVATTAAATAGAAAAGAAAASAAAAQPRPPAPPPAPAPAGPVPIGTVVQALPPGCVATPIGGVEYYNCAPGVYYRAAFQGNNLVYVAAQP